MLTRAQSVLFSAGIMAGVWTLGSSSAHADLDACGDIFLSGDASCGYEPREECMTQCMTVAVEQSCVAQVYNECETSCTTTASTECESTCTASCVNNCTTMTTTETGPSCKDLCLADCGGGSADGDRRSRCAKYTCERKCEARCGDDPEPTRVTSTTECNPTCTNACTASCTAKVNVECQQDCQERTYVQCEQRMVEQCRTQCEDKGGAIFCDGQFVNATNAESCADEIRLDVDIDIDVDAAIEEAGEDTGEAVEDVGNEIDEKVEKSCSVTNVRSGGMGGVLFALPLLALAFWRMRRRA
jgi:hypothetical protein